MSTLNSIQRKNLKSLLSAQGSTCATIAVMFPGQASQFIGMSRKLFASDRESQRLIAQAESVLQSTEPSLRLSRIMQEGPIEELTRPSIAQPAILTTSIAIWQHIKREMSVEKSQNIIFLGHSLGEYTALTAAHLFNFEDAIKLVHQRGLAMEATRGTSNFAMSALILLKGFEAGLLAKMNVTPPGQHVENWPQLLEEFVRDPRQPWNQGSESADLANINSSNQVVLSGTKAGVDKAAAYFQAEKWAARAVDLPVGAPFHSRFMKPASERLELAFKSIKMNDNIEVKKTIVIDNVSAKPVKNQLVKGVYSPVYWYPSIKYILSKHGPVNFLECGPRPVLGNLLKRDLTSHDSSPGHDRPMIISVCDVLE